MQGSLRMLPQMQRFLDYNPHRFWEQEVVGTSPQRGGIEPLLWGRLASACFAFAGGCSMIEVPDITGGDPNLWRASQ